MRVLAVAALGAVAIAVPMLVGPAGAAPLTVSQGVPPAGVVTVTAAPASSVFGQEVAFTATLPPRSAGDVVFSEGGTTLGTVTASGDTAVFRTSALAVGAHTITATNNGISGQATVAVAKAVTATTIEASANPSAAGQDVVFTITVAPVAPGAGKPTGTVQFVAGSAAPRPVLLSSEGVGTITASFPTAGTSAVTATYPGNDSFAESTTSVTHEVRNSGAIVVLTTSEADQVTTYGTSITFTATVAPLPPETTQPAGDVELFDGEVSLGKATLAGNTPLTFEVDGLAFGEHRLHATFTGSASVAPADSNELIHRVDQAETNTVATDAAGAVIDVTVSRLSTAAGAVEAGSPAAVPSGTVSVTKDGIEVGTGTLGADGKVQITTTALTNGTHSLTVTYGGDANHKSSSTTITKTIGAAGAGAGSGGGAGGAGGAAGGGGAIAATGSDADELVQVALLLLVGGAGALFLEADQRRRRRRTVVSLRRPSR